jgi:hypothetical protein
MIANDRIFNVDEMIAIENLFKTLANKCAQAEVSEYLNLTKYNISRSAIKIRIALSREHLPPFEFVHCLN